jgi:hypothetical protein
MNSVEEVINMGRPRLPIEVKRARREEQLKWIKEASKEYYIANKETILKKAREKYHKKRQEMLEAGVVFKPRGRPRKIMI